MNYLEYLLSKVGQECGELTKEASKAAIFGLDSQEPVSGETNRERIMNEYHDLYAIMELLAENGFIRFKINREQVERVKRKIISYGIKAKVLAGGEDQQTTEEPVFPYPPLDSSNSVQLRKLKIPPETYLKEMKMRKWKR